MRLPLQFVSVAVALLAAWLWWRASQQPPPTSFEVRHTGELDQGFQRWVRSSARANSWAARCTGAAVLLQAVANLAR